ncbi:ThuA domain-containing protein [Streptomyces sp. NPDC001046]|uniref:ThuA domain-containing protein n=1 Tax=Streptomyces sp. NPDC001046 TaxID=3364543 RepID=UPI0036AC6EB1
MSQTTPKQALVVRGGWEGHKPVETTDLFLPFLRDHDFDIRIESTPKVYADADYMSGVDLVLQCVTMSEIAPEEVAGLRNAVGNGTGLAGWHGGIADSYRANSEYLHLVGGQFASHPGKAPHDRCGDSTDYFLPHRITMLPAAADHPVTTGIEDFDLDTEQYWVLTDDYCDVLATTTLAARDFDPWGRAVTCPAIWTRSWGTGRIFVCTPGHSPDVLEDGNVRTVVERGMLWASR